MLPKFAAFLITLIVDIAVGVVVLLIMLMAMNGYSESDATWGLLAFALLALAAALLTSLGAVFLTGLLIKKQFRTAVSVLIAAPVFSIIGIVLEIVCGLIRVGVSEIVRVRF